MQQLVPAQRARRSGDPSLEHRAAQRLHGCFVGRNEHLARGKGPQRRPELDSIGSESGVDAALTIRRVDTELETSGASLA
jgi:hypothetical protein